MGKTPIEWSQFTVNPLRARLRSDPSKVGHYCEKPSPGCLNCYASTFQRRRGLPAFSGTHGRNLELVEPFLDVSKLEEVLGRRIPTTWFWCDMTDMFGSWVPMEHIAACYGVMAATPWHTHQVLTKRPGRALEFMEWAASTERWTDGKGPEPLGAVLCEATHVLDRALGGATVWPLPHVWFGISAERQPEYDERWPLARQVPAAVRFVSYEPALGPVDFRFPGVLKRTNPDGFDDWPEKRREEYVATAARAEFIARTETPDWVIGGGESGHKARPCDIEWLRSARDQCAESGTAYFCKQLGARPTWDGCSGPGQHWPTRTAMEDMRGHWAVRLKDKKGGDPSEWPPDLRVRQMPGDGHA